MYACIGMVELERGKGGFILEACRVMVPDQLSDSTVTLLWSHLKRGLRAGLAMVRCTQEGYECK